MDTNRPITHIVTTALLPRLDNLSMILENALGMFEPNLVRVREQPEMQIRAAIKAP